MENFIKLWDSEEDIFIKKLQVFIYMLWETDNMERFAELITFIPEEIERGLPELYEQTIHQKRYWKKLGLF